MRFTLQREFVDHAKGFVPAAPICTSHIESHVTVPPQERFDYIRSVLQPFLRTCGFRDSALQWLPAVGPLGENLVTAPVDPILKSWFHGPSVVDAIDAFTPRQRLVSKPLRLPVSDVFKSKSGESGHKEFGGRTRNAPHLQGGRDASSTKLWLHS